jgi:hypothetical protein
VRSRLGQRVVGSSHEKGGFAQNLLNKPPEEFPKTIEIRRKGEGSLGRPFLLSKRY